MNIRKLFLCAAGFVALSTAAANASSYSFSVFEGLSGGSPQTAQPVSCNTSSPPAGFACATFTYTGPLNFSNTATQNTDGTGDLNSTFFSPGTISNYVGNGTVTYNSQVVANFSAGSPVLASNFLASSGSNAGFGYASFYTIDLGTLAAGTILTITHDDGVDVSSNASDSGLTKGATVAVTETARVTTTGDVLLYYTRQNGTPSVLQVAVPEPASLSIFGAALLGLVGMAGLKRRNRKSV